MEKWHARVFARFASEHAAACLLSIGATLAFSLARLTCRCVPAPEWRHARVFARLRVGSNATLAFSLGFGSDRLPLSRFRSIAGRTDHHACVFARRWVGMYVTLAFSLGLRWACRCVPALNQHHARVFARFRVGFNATLVFSLGFGSGCMPRSRFCSASGRIECHARVFARFAPRMPLRARFSLEPRSRFRSLSCRMAA